MTLPFSPEQRNAAFLDFLIRPGDVHEVRAFEVRKSFSDGYKKTICGFFDDREKLIESAANLDQGYFDKLAFCPGTYITVNPVDPQLLAKANNRLVASTGSGENTKDANVIQRRTLFLDFDPRRSGFGDAELKKIMATDDEKATALVVYKKTTSYLNAVGFPEPAVLDSGNGVQVFYALDWPADDETDRLIEALVGYLSGRFTTAQCTIDTTTKNRSRICKFPGTNNRKGDATLNRPYRPTVVLNVPERRECVQRNIVEALVKDIAPPAPDKKKPDSIFDEPSPHSSCPELGIEPGGWATSNKWTKERVEEAMNRAGFEFRGPTDEGHRVRYDLQPCPFNEDHAGRDASVFLDVEGDKKGRIGFHCFHDGCVGNNFQTFKERLEPVASQPVTQQSRFDKFEKGLPVGGKEEPAIVDSCQSKKPESNSEDIHESYLNQANVKIEGITEDKGTRTYLVDCPCCDHYGAFTVNLTTYRRTYNCSGSKDISWSQAIRTNLVPQPKPQPFVIHRWSDVTRIAAEQSEDWFWEHWLEYGCLHMLTGRPFSGKSTMVMEMLAACFQGNTWHGEDIDQAPVILFDLENRERKIHSQITKCLDGDPGRIEELLFRVPPVVVPRPLTTQFIGKVIESIHATVEASGKKQGLILIDTFRSAFSAGADFNELDSSSMSRLLTPLKDLAMETGWAVLLLHHNKKGKDEFYGDNAIAGVLDYLWNWQCGEETWGGTDCRTLSVQGRSDAQRPIKFRYDRVTGRNTRIREVEDAPVETKKSEQIRSILQALPHKREDNPGRTQAVIQSTTDIPDGSLRKLLIQLVKDGLISVEGEGTKGNPKAYWLTLPGIVHLQED